MCQPTQGRLQTYRRRPCFSLLRSIGDDRSDKMCDNMRGCPERTPGQPRVGEKSRELGFLGHREPRIPVKRDAKWEIKEGCPTFRTAPSKIISSSECSGPSRSQEVITGHSTMAGKQTFEWIMGLPVCHPVHSGMVAIAQIDLSLATIFQMHLRSEIQNFRLC